MSDETVSCKTCGTEHPAIFKESEQAYRCAAVVSGNRIVGHYGSTVIDMEVRTFPAGRPSHVKEGVICDDCVTSLTESGVLALQETGVW